MVNNTSKFSYPLFLLKQLHRQSINETSFYSVNVVLKHLLGFCSNIVFHALTDFLHVCQKVIVIMFLAKQG